MHRLILPYAHTDTDTHMARQYRAARAVYRTFNTLKTKYPNQYNQAKGYIRRSIGPALAGMGTAAGTMLARRFKRKFPPFSLPSIGNSGNRKLFQSVRMSGSGSTRSYVKRYLSRRRGFSKRVREVSPKQYYQSNNGSKISQGFGRQQQFSSQFLTKTQLDAISNNVPSYNDNTTVLIKDVTNKFLISNTATANVYVDIYDFSYRKNTNTSPALLWRNGLVDSGMTAPFANVEEVYGITPLS